MSGPRRRPRLRRPAREPRIVRVADLLDAAPEDVRAALATRGSGTSYVAGTGAGTVVTLESTVPAARPFGRVAAIRNLQVTIDALRRELECPPVPSTSDRPE